MRKNHYGDNTDMSKLTNNKDLESFVSFTLEQLVSWAEKSHNSSVNSAKALENVCQAALSCMALLNLNLLLQSHLKETQTNNITSHYPGQQ